MITITYKEPNGKVSYLDCIDRGEMYLRLKEVRANGAKVIGVRNVVEVGTKTIYARVPLKCDDPQQYLWNLKSGRMQA